MLSKVTVLPKEGYACMGTTRVKTMLIYLGPSARGTSWLCQCPTNRFNLQKIDATSALYKMQQCLAININIFVRRSKDAALQL
jgi:hypothetical protein